MGKKKKLKKLVEKYIEERKTDDLQKEQEFKKRRDSRKERKRAIHSDKLLRFYRFLYIPTAVCCLCGTVMTFGSVVRSVGERTIFWTYRGVFTILGPVLLILGIILFFLSVGLVTTRRGFVKRNLKTNTQANSASKRASMKNKDAKLSKSASASVLSSRCHSIEELDEFKPLIMSHVSSTSSFQPQLGNSLSSNRLSRQSSVTSRVSFKEEVTICDDTYAPDPCLKDVEISRRRRAAKSLLKFQELNKKFKRNICDESGKPMFYLEETRSSQGSDEESDSMSGYKIKIIIEAPTDDDNPHTTTEIIKLNGYFHNHSNGIK